MDRICANTLAIMMATNTMTMLVMIMEMKVPLR